MRMNYQGVVRNGVVVLEDGASLAEGTPVDVTPMNGGAGSLSELAAFGLWRDRKDLGDSAAEALRLRALTERRGADG